MHFKLVVLEFQECTNKFNVIFVWLEAVVRVFVDGLVMWETGCFVVGNGEEGMRGRFVATYLQGGPLPVINWFITPINGLTNR